MDGVNLAEFLTPGAGGNAVPVCLESARWFCRLLRADQPPDPLSDAVGRLVEAYLDAAEAIGSQAPTLLSVRGLLSMVARAVTGDPSPSETGFRDLQAHVRAAPATAMTASARRHRSERGRECSRVSIQTPPVIADAACAASRGLPQSGGS